MVALRKESVDRNGPGVGGAQQRKQSLSARRAWIEIRRFCGNNQRRLLSLSARRAWIEIILPITSFATKTGRSPQGERG